MKFSNFISYFFHPINFSIVGAFLYFLLLPKYIFKPHEHLILTVIFVSTYIFPLILLYLMRRFKMINSYHMNTVEERKFPTILFISISYFVGIHLYKTKLVDILALFYIAYGLCLTFTYLFLYFKQKISLHTAAIGGLIGFMLYYSYYFELNLIYLIAFLFVLSGVIASARLRVQAHNVREVIIGFLLGILTQLVVFIAYSI